MFKYLLILSLLFVPLAARAADEPFQPVYGVQYTEERIVSLPQDQDKHFLTLIGDPADAKFAQVQTWFRSHPGLVNFRNQTHYNVYAKGTVMYAERYGRTTNQQTTIRLQDGQGRVIYQASGDNIPMSADALTRAVNTECILFRRWRENRAQPSQPFNEQPVTPDQGDQVVPPLDNVPPDTITPSKPGINMLWVILGGVGGFIVGSAVGLGYAYKRQYYANAS